MELYVLRHAIAEERNPIEYPDDAARPLTAEGRRRMRRGARGLARMGAALDLILSSPYARAWDTAEIVAGVLDARHRLEAFPPLAAEVAPEEAVAALAGRLGGMVSVMLVGHEPQLSAIGSILLAGRSDVDLRLGKGGSFKLLCPRIQPRGATLEWWLTPRQLRRLAP